MGDRVVHLDALRVEHADGTLGAITTREAELLRYLATRAGQWVTREELLRALWNLEAGKSRTLDTHMARLRRKVERDPHRPRFVRTRYGVGYKFDLQAPEPEANGGLPAQGALGRLPPPNSTRAAS